MKRSNYDRAESKRLFFKMAPHQHECDWVDECCDICGVYSPNVERDHLGRVFIDEMLVARGGIDD